MSPIDEKYAEQQGILGNPRDVERDVPGGQGGRYRDYDRGSIYWTPALGAHEVHGAIRDKWVALGGAASFLGFPVTDETKTPNYPDVYFNHPDGYFNHFEGGSIYWTPATGAHEVRGAIRDKWADLGWERGVLGFPTTDLTETPGAN